MVGKMRFGLRGLFIGVTIVAVIFGLFAFTCRHFFWYYHEQVRTVRSVLAEYPEIDQVWFGINDDVQLEVEDVWFSTVDQPGLVFYCVGIDHRPTWEFREGLEKSLQEKLSVTLPDWATQY